MHKTNIVVSTKIVLTSGVDCALNSRSVQVKAYCMESSLYHSFNKRHCHKAA